MSGGRSPAGSAAQAAAANPANAAIAVVLGVYLAIVLWQGNLGALASAVYDDFIGTPQRDGFWRWAVALLILIWLARVPSLAPVFGPALVIAIVGMLIYAAERNPSLMDNLDAGLRTLFGRS